MTQKILCWAAALTLSAAASILAQTNTVSTAPFDLYILMGQSNMAGRGDIEPQDQTPHPQVLVFSTNENWNPAVEPITRDPNKKHGVGPGLAFGKLMADKNSSRKIGLVPCAVGGTPLERWEPGGDLYSNAVYRARAATKYGTIKGFLWHQGESDSTEERAGNYGDRLAKMITALRAELGATNAPFVVGQLGEFLFTRTNKPNQFAKQINLTLAGLPSRVPLVGCVESKGLVHKGDDLHFDSASQRELGKRFVLKMQSLQDTARYPRVDLGPIYQVDPSWPQRSADAPWAAISGLELDKQDQIWIYTRTTPTVQVYAPDGRCIKKWPKTNPKSVAHSIRIDPDGFVWLLDIGLHVARKHTTEGEVLLTIGTEGVAGEDETHFNKPTDIAFGPSGDLFISDGYGNNRIVHFSKEGKFIKTWGQLGVAPGEFSLPHAIVCDRNGRLYVADRNNGRVQVFDTAGKLLDVWSNIVVPWSLWLSPEGHIWTCGSSPMPWQFEPKYPNAPLSCPPKDQMAVKFDQTGKVLQLWTFPKGEDGAEKPGELNWLHNVLLDSKGNMYCTDIIGKRLQKFVLQTNLTVSSNSQSDTLPNLMKTTVESKSAKKPLRIIVFGAHQDDCELNAGGVAALWAARGHAVKFVNTTCGDTGHWRDAGGPLARRRNAEVAQAAKLLGITTETLDIHDGELMPTLENRKTFIRLIREWEADIVISPRPYDYHPDHRYTAMLVQDAAFMVIVPFVCPDVPILKRNPIFLFNGDRFQKPIPFKPDIAVCTDSIFDKKLEALALLESQFLEGGCLGSERLLPKNAQEREKRSQEVRDMLTTRFKALADKHRSCLVDCYGVEKGGKIETAEVFEICEYGRQPTREELKEIIPF